MIVVLRVLERLLGERPAVVLDVGHDLAAPGELVLHGALRIAAVAADPITMQLPERFHAVVLGEPVMSRVAPQYRRALVHNAVQHLLPGGLLVASLPLASSSAVITGAEYDELCRDCDLVPSGHRNHRDGRLLTDSGEGIDVRRRTDRFTIHDLVYEARGVFPRVSAADLATQLDGPKPPLVVDTRTQTDRARFGVIAGSIHVPRTVLEWHLDPANGYRHPAATSLHQPLVLVCNRGYSSSLGAASLVRLGFTAVADLIGGVQAWIDEGLPVVPADHDHLDL